MCLVVVSLPGCSGPDGPLRYELSGKVTHGGEPVPAGVIHFVPDAEEGNQGPGTTAQIHDGTYATPPGMGIIGGPHVITVAGTDGVDADGESEMGSALFPPHTLKIDLPKGQTAYDIDVPLQPSNH